MLYPPPAVVEAEEFTRLPDRFRVGGTVPAWGAANKPGRPLDSFLEGPSFDRAGNLWVTDIPYGRVFRVDPDGEWTLAAEYDGWPNGLKIHRDGTPYIADYKRGILRLDPATGAVEEVVTHRHSEHFRGCNDLFFDAAGRLYFTDQGQSGLHMPNGRVYRLDLATGRLDLLIDNAPSPNGLVTNDAQDALYVAMTRGNAVWRLPFMADGAVSKAGLFVQVSGGLSGPDGMALDEAGGLWVAHAGNGCVWHFGRLGEPLTRVMCPGGLTTTNLAFGGEDRRTLYVTQSDTGRIMRVRTEVAGRAMFSHAGAAA